MQIYEKLLLLRKPNEFGLRLPLNFRHNSIHPFPFDAKEKPVLFIWNTICIHVYYNRKRPHEINDKIVEDLVTFDLHGLLVDYNKSNLYRYLKRLEDLQLILKNGSNHIVSPWYCNNLSQTQKDYIIKHLQVLYK